MGVFDVTDHHPDGVRFSRVHAAGELIGPVLQLFGGSQHPLTYVVAHSTVVAQGAGRLGLGHLGGSCDVGDSDIAAPGSITIHYGLS